VNKTETSNNFCTLTPIAPHSKIALGTVQLGLTYGINNQTGKPDEKAAFEILDTAHRNGIQVLDSAEAYGNSLQVIGRYVRERENHSFRIISKFIADGNSLTEKIEEQIASLSVAGLYGYMYHRFSDYQAGSNREELLSLKGQSKIEKIGVSVYGTDELREVVNDPDIDIIQLPFNPFDSSEEKKELLRQAKSNRLEVHVRSVFLQGLFFREPATLTGNLQKLSAPLHEFLTIIRKHNLTPMQACLNYALHQSCIDYVVIGVETSGQLVENLSNIQHDLTKGVEESLESIRVDDKSMLNPAHWRP
jgi:aryl-alcohol dehydrogenase-like predicted oxidoreductase